MNAQPTPTEPTLSHAYSALLPTLPGSWFPKRGPLVVTIKLWSDGTISAELPAADIKGDRVSPRDGLTECDALSLLGKAIVERAKQAESKDFKGFRQPAANLLALIDRPRGVIINGEEVFF